MVTYYIRLAYLERSQERYTKKIPDQYLIVKEFKIEIGGDKYTHRSMATIYLNVIVVAPSGSNPQWYNFPVHRVNDLYPVYDTILKKLDGMYGVSRYTHKLISDGNGEISKLPLDQDTAKKVANDRCLLHIRKIWK